LAKTKNLSWWIDLTSKNLYHIIMILSVILLIIFFLLFLFILRYWLVQLEKKASVSQELIQWLQSQTSLTDQKITQQINIFNERIDKTLLIINQLQKTVGEFSEIGREIKELQNFLSPPKMRGNLGEQILTEILMQYFPKNTFKLQYQFKNGEKVDAVIITSQGLIPIDCKFPLENFKKYLKETNGEKKQTFKKLFVSDVKKHIQTIAKKYILPDEKTVNYALMYIPSENIYYEIINDEELFDYAGKMMVLPVSPLSFYAYLKAILISFEGQKIEEKAKFIINLLAAIRKDYQKINNDFSLLNRHLNNAYNQAINLSKNLQSLENKLSTTNLLEDKIQ